MLSFIKICWLIIQILIGYNLVLPVLLFLLYRIKPVFQWRPAVLEQPGPDYAIIVTAYEQTDTLPAAVQAILQMHYPHYLVYVVADKCDISQLHFPDERIILLRPETVLASNTRSHFYAIRHFRRPHTHLVIIDSDNIVDPALLTELNKGFASGFQAVQGERKAKNLDTTYACLDAARDIYYHFYDGRVLFGIGSSATLAGSGMAFTVSLYREALENTEVSGAGFDKVLQYQIVSKGHRIAFQGDAVVFDEKTSRPAQLVNQRARWINTWFRYFRFGFGLIGKGVSKPDWNQLIFGLVLLRPPLFLFLLAAAGCMFTDLLLGDFTAAWYWIAGWLFFILAFFISLAQSGTDKRILLSLWRIPAFVFYQVLSLRKVRKANKHSVATQHFHTDGMPIDHANKKDPA
ncbi:MAG TPA: glycosyltransferase [Sediminibacterium sp.]|nr:glycosyltransferase [Sediminibacterium sp.]